MIGTAMAMLIAGLASGSATAASAKMASGAAKKAGEIQADAATRAEAEARREDDLNRAQYDKEYQRSVDLQDAELARRKALMDAVAGERAGLTGQPATLSALAPRGPLAATPPPMPTGWKPGDPIPSSTDAPAPAAAAPPVNRPLMTPPPSLAALAPAAAAPPPTAPSTSSLPTPPVAPPVASPTDGSVAPPAAYVPYMSRYRPQTLAALRY